MMKPLTGLIVLFFSLSQAQFHYFPMWLSCTSEHLMIMMDRDFFRNGIFLQPHHVFLGNYCRVTSVTPERLFLVYGLEQCGIEIEVTPSEIYIDGLVYVYRDDIPAHPMVIPVTCTLTRESGRKLMHFLPWTEVLETYDAWKDMPLEAPTSWAHENVGQTNKAYG